MGRKRLSRELRELIGRMGTENPTWGAPRIHGELLKLGFDLSERTVSRWMRRGSRTPDNSRLWKAFLSNHREAIAAMDFFTVPTLSFSVLYCFFVIAHDRRRILHFNVTRRPTSLWIAQQLREAFPADHMHEFLIFDQTPNLGMKSFQPCRQLSLRPSELHSKALGKMVWQSAGWEVVDAICLIM